MPTALFPDKLTFLHNPRCSKSRAARSLLQERNVDFAERAYLDEPLSAEELRELARRLGRAAREWVRKGEAAFKEAGLNASSSDDDILAAMARHPILVERPILIARDRAVVGRPPEQVLELVS